MQRIFLLRAYGDFVIALQAIAKSKRSIQIVASDHLAPLYQALITAAVIPPLSIEFIALGIKNGQLNFFTNKYLFSLDTWFQLRKLKAYIKSNPNQDGVDWLEQSIRLKPFNFLLGHLFKAVVPIGAKVYQAYDQWLLIDQVDLQDQDFKLEQPLKLIAIPDARLAKRMIQPSLLKRLTNYALSNGFELKIARMRVPMDATDLIYENFDQLIQLMVSADYIICTDSLPAHLASLLNKPHCIFYPYQGKTDFFTPYAIKHNATNSFAQYDFTFLNRYVAS